MGRFTEEELKIAKSVDLVDLAENVHIPLKRKGNVYCLQEMDSAVIFNRATWYRYSQSVGGSTIDFLMYFENMRYDEAVSYLLDFAGYIKMNPQDQTTRRKKKEPARPKPKKKAFVLPDRSGTCRGIYAYLIKQRKLSKKVIRYWVEQDLMYESLPYHNIVFLGKAADGKVRFASQRGIRDAYGKVFKGDVEGNDKKYGVNLIHKGNETLNVYEAAIDAMSDMDFRSDYGMNILALGMVSDGPLQTILHEYPEIKTLNFCLDNDGPGRKAAKRLGRKYVLEGYEVFLRLPPFGKDHNFFLQCERENRELWKKVRHIQSRSGRNMQETGLRKGNLDTIFQKASAVPEEMHENVDINRDMQRYVAYKMQRNIAVR